MDLMDKERALNNYIDIIKAHIEGKTILFKDYEFYNRANTAIGVENK